jgi:hypothetical protein
MAANEATAKFRDFIYLDLDRVQSILAQLEEGLLTDMMEGRAREAAVNVGIGGLGVAGLLAQFLPVSANVEGKVSSDIQQSKVLHVDASDLEWSELAGRETSFVLVRGAARFVDYDSLKSYADHEPVLQRITSRSGGQGQQEVEPPPNRQQRRLAGRQGQRQNQVQGQERAVSALDDISNLVVGYLGSLVQFRITNSAETEFVGLMTRSHLREDIKSLIFKFGSQPQGTWVALALLRRVPEPGLALQARSRLNNFAIESNIQGTQSVSDAIDSALFRDAG